MSSVYFNLILPANFFLSTLLFYKRLPSFCGATVHTSPGNILIHIFFLIRQKDPLIFCFAQC